MSLTINPYTRQPYSEFADHYLACDRCHEAKVREGDGETTCEECKAIIAEDGAEIASSRETAERWTIARVSNPPALHIHAPDRTVAMIGGATERHLADARLLAAAPGLLAALRAVVDFRDRPTTRFNTVEAVKAAGDAMWAQVDSALAKAVTS